MRSAYPLMIAVLLCLPLSSVPQDAVGLDLYVSTSGKDPWSGRLPAPSPDRTDGPFATLERARGAIRAARAQGPVPEPVTVHIRAGIYRPSQPFVLTSIDSGTSTAPITYSAYRNEKVTLSGTRPLSNCAPLRPSLRRCDVSSLRLDRLPLLGDPRVTGDVPQFELFIRNRRMPLARWPNLIDARPGSPEWSYVAGIDKSHPRDRFNYAGDRPRSWSQPKEAQVHIWPGNDWYDQYAGVLEIDAQSKQLILTNPAAYPLAVGRRFYVRNLREELDAPGEWYYDRTDQSILYLPLTANAPDSPEVSTLDNIIVLDNASYVTLNKLTLTGSRRNAIDIKGGIASRLQNLEIQNTGGHAISVVGGRDHLVNSCEIHETGRAGVLLEGGDRKTLTSAGHRASRNHIHHYSRLLLTQQPAIGLVGVGNHAIDNYIHHGPNMGIMLKGNDHQVERNRLHDLCEESSDCGAFYTGRDWTYRGNTLTHNVFHDIWGYRLAAVDNPNERVRYVVPGSATAVYLDDATSGFRVHGNTFYRVGFIMVHIGGGRDNLIENNVFIDPARAIWIDDRWPTYNWQANLSAMADIPIQGTAWKGRYFLLSKPMRNYRWPEGNHVLRNIIARLRPSQRPEPELHYEMPADATTIDKNVVWSAHAPIRVEYRFLDTNQGGTVNFPEWRHTGFDASSRVADPQMPAFARDDFHLLPTSPALTLGFKPIPYDSIATAYTSKVRAAVSPRLRPDSYVFTFDGAPVDPQ